MMQIGQSKQLQHSLINGITTKQTIYIAPPGDGGLGGQRACGDYETKRLLRREVSY
jgi:hypothetical protein